MACMNVRLYCVSVASFWVFVGARQSGFGVVPSWFLRAILVLWLFKTLVAVSSDIWWLWVALGALEYG